MRYWVAAEPSVRQFHLFWLFGFPLDKVNCPWDSFPEFISCFWYQGNFPSNWPTELLTRCTLPLELRCFHLRQIVLRVLRAFALTTARAEKWLRSTEA